MYNNSIVTKYPELAAEIISKRTSNFKPKIAIILGSGLGRVAQKIKQSAVIPYDDLPYFSVSRIEGHGGNLHIGMLNNIPVVCLEGRTHTYEGGNALEVIKNIVYTLKLIGCETLFTTNAVGSLNKDVGVGRLVLIKDHINFMFSNNILLGPNNDKFGDRFVSMDNVYNSELRQKILAVAKKHQIPLGEGIYLGTSGPTFETHAEIRAFKILGADIIGMSTIPEVIAARHCGMKVISLSAVTNLAAGLSDETLTHEGTLKGAALAIENMANLILNSIQEIAK